MPTDADSVRPGRLRRIITSPFRHWRWAVAGLVGLAAVYAAVDQVLMKRLAVQLDRLRAAGRPATFAELGVGNLPPAENAAPLYRAAGKNTEAVLSGAREADLRERLVNATTCPRHAQDDDHDYSLLTEAEKQEIAGEMRAMEPELARVLDLSITGSTGGNGQTPGLVLLGETAMPMSGVTFAAHLAARLGREPLHIAGTAAPIRRLAWCSGAAQSLIAAALEAGVDGFITGEAAEQTVHFARENSLHFFAAGHHATERHGIQALGAHLSEQTGLHCRFIDIDNPV